MIKLNPTLAAGVLFAVINISPADGWAATEHSDIQINVIHDEYVRIVGTAAGASRMYSNYDVATWIFPNTVDLGTIGLESNMSGNCDFSMTTINNFRLLHTVTGESLTP